MRMVDCTGAVMVQGPWERERDDGIMKNCTESRANCIIIYYTRTEEGHASHFFSSPAKVRWSNELLSGTG